MDLTNELRGFCSSESDSASVCPLLTTLSFASSSSHLLTTFTCYVILLSSLSSTPHLYLLCHPLILLVLYSPPLLITSSSHPPVFPTTSTRYVILPSSCPLHHLYLLRHPLPPACLSLLSHLFSPLSPQCFMPGRSQVFP